MESIKQEKSNLMSINPISKHMSTPINMGGSYSKSPAKATNFPIKEKTKLGKDEKVSVRIQGVETMFSDLGKAKASLANFRKSNPNAPAGDRGAITGVTDLGGGQYTEKRKTDSKATGKRSAQLKADDQKISAKFSLVTDKKSGNVSRKYN
jgi:hypothetical protein|tara:strand:+ start:752 stop:1204 length:453 start_codon:yes stop_codon:yes gene_type:complete